MIFLEIKKFFKENPDKEYVVFCGVDGQETLSTKTMKDMGINNVKNLTGGMAQWKKKYYRIKLIIFWIKIF